MNNIQATTAAAQRRVTLAFVADGEKILKVVDIAPNNSGDAESTARSRKLRLRRICSRMRILAVLSAFAGLLISDPSLAFAAFAVCNILLIGSFIISAQEKRQRRIKP